MLRNHSFGITYRAIFKFKLWEHILRKLTVHLTCVLSSIFAYPAFALDVSGMELGSDVNVAVQSAKQANPRFDILQLGNNSALGAFIGTIPDQADWQQSGRTTLGSDYDRVDEVVAFQAPLSKVWFAARLQRLPKDKSFTIDALADALRKKYGNPSAGYRKGESNGELDRLLIWAYDRSGKQVVNGLSMLNQYPEQTPCLPLINFSMGVKIGIQASGMPSNNFNTTIELPTDSRESCGKLLVAKWEQASGLVMNYSVAAYDVKAMHDYRVLMSKQSEAGRQKAIDDQANKRVTPKL